MEQQDLKPGNGAKRPRRRVGRGDSSGHGSYSGRGIKGQNSRSGGGVRPGFEGGQLPIIKRLPRLRGFTSRTDNEFSVVNVDRLARFPANSRVTVEDLVQAGLIRDTRTRVKILGRGALEAPLSVEAHRVTPSAREKIEKAGGTVVEIA